MINLSFNKKLSVGVDIENIERFSSLEYNKNMKFYNDIFTKKEVKYCLSKPNPYQHFAVRFAGKEAVIKLLSSFGIKTAFKNIEILAKNKIPLVNILDSKIKNLEIFISMSHCKDQAVAFVVGCLKDS